MNTYLSRKAVLLRSSVVITTILMTGCMSGTAYDTQKKNQSAREHIVTLRKPFFFKSYFADVPKVYEIDQVRTANIATVRSAGELWVVQELPNKRLRPIAQATEVAKAYGGRELHFKDGRPSVTLDGLEVAVCSADPVSMTCDALTDMTWGRVAASGDGHPVDSKSGVLTFNLNMLTVSGYYSLSQPEELDAASLDVRKQYSEKVAHDKVEAGRKRQEWERAEVRRVEVWRNAPIGTMDYCQSIMLKSVDAPVGSGDGFTCERGKIFVAELTKAGWEITSMSRQRDTDNIGREADSVSITVKKVGRAAN
ncbi:hypothetical protein [Burkholderia gladioli]|uniref:hypothetical protein n=1 Tax=Burkholderia gladioli TaxID=28095 RepID=UPI002363312D|nr:hypothetical protein [Burkholderia gladioli]MDD1790157.1 hypothetical protein [Burkholderia gladioli]